MLTCGGAPMRISHAARSRAATGPQKLTVNSSIRRAACPLSGRRDSASLFWRVGSLSSDTTASTQPNDSNGRSSPATTATTSPDSTSTPDPTEPIPVPTNPAVAAATDASSAAPKVNENFTGDMLKPSIVNTPFVRAASVLAAVAAVAGSTLLLPNTFGAFLHVTSYAILLGSQLWNTFFVGITMFKNLPRQTFGKVQSKLFPQYFTLTAGANLLALVTLALAGASATAAGVRALVALGLSLGGLLVNWLVLEPICTNLMFQRYDIENLPEKTEGDKARIAALYKQFGKWHGISSLVNLISFCVAVGHGWFLASLLVVAA